MTKLEALRELSRATVSLDGAVKKCKDSRVSTAFKEFCEAVGYARSQAFCDVLEERGVEL